jgi:hypothetical protein
VTALLDPSGAALRRPNPEFPRSRTCWRLRRAARISKPDGPVGMASGAYFDLFGGAFGPSWAEFMALRADKPEIISLRGVIAGVCY